MLKNIIIEENQYLTNIFSGNGLSIINTPRWLPKANFSRTQTDLIATSPEGEQVVFIDYFTNFDLPNIQTENGLVLFDLGSAVDLEHPKAHEFLKRDIENISNFFVKRGLTVKNPIDIINEVTK